MDPRELSAVIRYVALVIIIILWGAVNNFKINSVLEELRELKQTLQCTEGK